MRIFVLAMVAVFGIAMFAVAALAWDRRSDLVDPSFRPFDRLPFLRTAAGGAEGQGTAEGGGGGVQAPPRSAVNRRYLPHGIVLGSILLGSIMIIGSCAGVLHF